MKRIKRNEAPDEKARVYARVRIGPPLSARAFGRTSEFCFSKKKKKIKKRKIGKIEKKEKRQKPVIRGSTTRKRIPTIEQDLVTTRE